MYCGDGVGIVTSTVGTVEDGNKLLSPYCSLKAVRTNES